ncbi:MAG: STT3 domain-containing protein [Candidatus Omnitrophica bacterium]|nr:STT3 domain-containing protein [Candidatus Omnitrophota bacterium]
MKKIITPAICLLAVLSLNIYFRTYPITFPQFRDEAESIVRERTSRAIAEQVQEQNPQLSNFAKEKLFARELAEHRKKNRSRIRQEVLAEYDKLKDRFQDKNGQTYLMELDCWHWARYVANIDRHGFPGDKKVNGKQLDTYMSFPDGSPMLWNNFFYYFSWFCYKAFSTVVPVPIFTFLFYLPLFFVALFICILYLFCFRNFGNTVAIIACLFAGLSPIFIPRSCAGWFDMDVLNLIYPVLIIWAYLRAYHAPTARRTVIWAVASAFWLGLFCATWIGWSFIFFILVAYEGLMIANLIAERVQYKEEIASQVRRHLFIPALFLAAGIFWVILFSGFQPFEVLVTQVRDVLRLNNALTASVWPNVFFTVGELKKVDYIGIAKSVGGVLLFLASLVSMLAVFVRIKRYTGFQRDLAVMLVVWFMVMFFFCSKGVRFTMFLAIPMGIYLGWGFEQAYAFIGEKPWKKAGVPVFLAVVVFAVLTMISTADRVAIGTLPLMEDGWYSVLTRIRDFTPKGSVINSWWDFGDWFKVVAERPVIFDGQSQNSPRAFWMARVLLTDSEQEAVGILRMLNNGGNRAYDLIERRLRDPFASVILVRKLILADPQEGRRLLASKLEPAEAAEVAHILYDTPPQKAYFIVEPSLLGKMPAISYLGNWDFVKVYLARAVQTKSGRECIADLVSFGMDAEAAARLYDEARLVGPAQLDHWISGRFMFPAIAMQEKSQEDVVLFNNGFIYNPDKKTLYAYSAREERYRVPQSLFLESGAGGIEEFKYENATLNYSALIQENNDSYKLILMSQPLARSMFVRLYFLEGKGAARFKPFTRERQGQDMIGVYEVLWE